ncbi:unnamed protein product [Acidithrix sp. C25]|nr:unnamed protein product [Acidithrix sp. C25]
MPCVQFAIGSQNTFDTTFSLGIIEHFAIVFYKFHLRSLELLGVYTYC